MGIRGRIRHIIVDIRNSVWFATHNYNLHFKSEPEAVCKIWDSLTMFWKENKDVTYKVETIDCGGEGEYKWVGGAYTPQAIIGIPSGTVKALIIHEGDPKIETKGALREGPFKWTAGCFYRNKIYGFPRTANSLVVMDESGIREEKLAINYSREHHYGGVCTEEGIVYLPPRSTDHILRINLNTKEVEKIIISKGFNFRYCGSIIHPNGLIYMFPEYKEKVMVLDPKTDKIGFIGNVITSMVFGACVAPDGNIYGYSGYEKGLLKINVKTNTVKMLYQDVNFDCFGSAVGINGEIMGIPGNGNTVYSYDCLHNELKRIATIPDECKEKCAGSAMDSYGNIYCIPAYGGKIYKLTPQKKTKIEARLLNSRYLNGNY